MKHYLEITPEEVLNSEIQLSDIKTLTEEDTKLKFTRGAKSKLPTWYCFILYYMLGSSQKAADYIASTGVRTPRGNKYAQNVVLWNAWEWAILNPDKAKPFFQKDAKITGRELTEPEYMSELLQHAMTYKNAFSDQKLLWWMKTYNLTSDFYVNQIKLKRPEVYRELQAGNN